MINCDVFFDSKSLKVVVVGVGRDYKGKWFFGVCIRVILFWVFWCEIVYLGLKECIKKMRNVII